MENKRKILADLGELAYAKKGPVKTGIWRGLRAIKYPTDLMLYAELIQQQRPDLIVECGTRFGGAALFLADVCEIIGYGHVVTVEISDEFGVLPEHPRLTALRGSSTDREIVKTIHYFAGKTAMVILDSDHSAPHVLEELRLYSGLVHVGGYIIVEDTRQEVPNGPARAIELFLKENKAFVIDRDVEKYGIHNAAGGFLRRVK